jgi:signal transduction histidine kinase
MNRLVQWQSRFLRSRWLPVAVILVSLAVLGGTILFARLHLGRSIREQIAGRDGAVLYAVTLMQQLDRDLGLTGSIDDPAEQLDLALRTSRLKGVVAVRLFTPEGRFANALPANVAPADLAAEDLPRLKALKPVSRFHGRAQLEEIFFLAPAADAARTMPLLEVNVPLHAEKSQRLAGVAQFIIEGHSMAAEFSTLDRSLNWQAALAFLVGGGTLVLTLGWAFRRLAERTAHLQRANQQLALAAKTSAVGAVTAHLIHGLRNPLTGLEMFVATRNQRKLGSEDAVWEQAISATRRMQTIINDVIGVLREVQQTHSYEITAMELADIVAVKTRPLAREKGVEFSSCVEVAGALSNHAGNLLSLILINLVQNAIQATPAGRRVELALSVLDGVLICEVRDEGSGIPAAHRGGLFTPCQSSKEGGSGIGLAISKQLADHLGAHLELKSTSGEGTVFIVTLSLQHTQEAALVAEAEAVER